MIRINLGDCAAHGHQGHVSRPRVSDSWSVIIITVKVVLFYLLMCTLRKSWGPLNKQCLRIPRRMPASLWSSRGTGDLGARERGWSSFLSLIDVIIKWSNVDVYVYYLCVIFRFSIGFPSAQLWRRRYSVFTAASGVFVYSSLLCY